MIIEGILDPQFKFQTMLSPVLWCDDLSQKSTFGGNRRIRQYFISKSRTLFSIARSLPRYVMETLEVDLGFLILSALNFEIVLTSLGFLFLLRGWEIRPSRGTLTTD